MRGAHRAGHYHRPCAPERKGGGDIKKTPKLYRNLPILSHLLIERYLIFIFDGSYPPAPRLRAITHQAVCTPAHRIGHKARYAPHPKGRTTGV